MLTFVDAVGGGLASLAASLASARGHEARACSTAPVAPRPEVARALKEVGIESPVAAAPYAPRAGERVFAIGPAPVAADRSVDLDLYEGPGVTEFGPTDLERLAAARIARDRLERWLEDLS